MKLDAVKGTLWGQAIGDALGVPYEYKTASQLRGVSIHYQDVTRKNAQFKSGDFSDDTEMAMALLDAYLLGLEKFGRSPEAPPEPRIIAERFKFWADRDGRGMGGHTRKVLSDPAFLEDPLEVSRSVWAASGYNSAPNGAVMRASYVGLMNPTADAAWTAQAANLCASVTHYDPRCVMGAQGVALVVRNACMGLTSSHEEVLTYVRKGMGATVLEDPILFGKVSLEDLQLDEGMGVAGTARKQAPIGYTWKAAGAGFWALREAYSAGASFEDLLVRIIQEGGDADTNAAVVGGMLGGVWGYSNIPKHLIDGIYWGSALRLEALYQRLLASYKARGITLE